jgi:bZIP-type transcription factor MBZ1
MGNGVTPVHTTLVPDISTFVRKGLQENMNPSLNAIPGSPIGNGIASNKVLGGFDGFADLNPFTMKTLDAYVSFPLLLYPPS